MEGGGARHPCYGNEKFGGQEEADCLCSWWTGR
jgi:hypothetical protein